jgi:hypothetical protein
MRFPRPRRPRQQHHPRTHRPILAQPVAGVSSDGPWIFRQGWIVLAGLTVANLVVDLLASGNQAPVAWVTGPAVFLPHFVRRLEESYYDGVAEAELEIKAGARGEERPPGL